MLTLLLAVAAGIFAAATGLLIHAVVRRGAPKLSRLFRALRTAVFLLAGLLLLCFVYAHIEPYWPQVTHTEIACARLPAGTRLRLVQISDLHCGAEPFLERRLPALVAEQNPDAIAFTGDALNSLEGLPAFRECMTRLAKIAPTFAARGNWDLFMEEGRGLDIFEGTGVTALDGSAVPLETRGVTVWIAGATLWGQWRIEEALDQVPEGAPTILLYHLPAGVVTASQRGVDLVCAGHTHGGQVVLPFYGAPVNFSGFSKRYQAGLYRVEGTWLYVNRGLGTEVRHPVRFLCRPEVAVIDLIGQK